MIWLVDDDDEDLGFFQEALQRNGYSGDIRTISNGNQLMELLMKVSPTAIPSSIVLDLNMPTKSGIEVLADLKSDPRLRGIPIMILSGSADKNDEQMCLALGCERYWKKPESMHEYDMMANYLINLF